VNGTLPLRPASSSFIALAALYIGFILSLSNLRSSPTFESLHILTKSAIVETSSVRPSMSALAFDVVDV
jgi:ribosomal protein S8E